MENQENILSAELQIGPSSHAYLAETAKWGTFLSILGFIGSAFIAIIALFAGTIYGSLMRGIGGGIPGTATIFITIVYLIIAVVNFFMAFFLYKFSREMKIALKLNDQASLDEAFKNQKNMYKLIGILTAIYLGFVVLAMVFGGLAAAFS